MEKSDRYNFSVLDIFAELLHSPVFLYSLEISKSHLPATDSTLSGFFSCFKKSFWGHREDSLKKFLVLKDTCYSNISYGNC